MEFSIISILGGISFTLVWAFALMGLIDALGPLKRRFFPPRQSTRKHFFPSTPWTRA